MKGELLFTAVMVSMLLGRGSAALVTGAGLPRASYWFAAALVTAAAEWGLSR